MCRAYDPARPRSARSPRPPCRWRMLQADECLAIVRRVALKVPPERSGLLRQCQFIVRQREMVESDLAVPGCDQRFCNGCRLLRARRAPRKRRLVDHPLMLLEGRNMRVAEHGEAIGPHDDCGGCGFHARAHRLVRQSIDQVEADPPHAAAPQAFDRRGSLFLALDPVYGALDDGIEALDAEARAADARRAQCAGHGVRQRARVDLDGDCRLCRDIEACPQQVHQREELGRLDDGRRASAEMHFRHRQPSLRRGGDDADLPAQHGQIVEDGLVLPGYRGVTAAVPAHRPAERNVQVE